MTAVSRADLALRAVDDAAEIICAVHDKDRVSIDDLLTARNTRELQALVVVLAAALSPSVRLHEALAWADPDSASARETPLRPCGTHAAFIRHKKRGEPVDDDCVVGERRYQRLRNRAWRKRGVVTS